MAVVILGKYVLYLPISTFPISLINDHFSGPNFSKAQAVQLIQRLSVEERRIFLKELKKVVPAPKHVQLTVSLLYRLTRDNHVQTNQHRGNYDSWHITTLFPSSALASSTTSSWLLLGSTLTLPLEWSLAYLPWWVFQASRSWHDCSLGSCSPGQHPLGHDGDWERLVTE